MFGWFKTPDPEPPKATSITLGFGQWSDLFFEEALRVGLLPRRSASAVQVISGDGHVLTVFWAGDRPQHEVAVSFPIWSKWAERYLQSHPSFAELVHPEGNPLRMSFLGPRNGEALFFLRWKRYTFNQALRQTVAQGPQVVAQEPAGEAEAPLTLYDHLKDGS